MTPCSIFFFFNDTATTEIYTLSLHDALPIYAAGTILLQGSGQGGATEVVHDPYPKISHSDCERVSQQLSVILDVEELIPGPAGYTLEVSSPGMERALKKPADFERCRRLLAKTSTS